MRKIWQPKVHRLLLPAVLCAWLSSPLVGQVTASEPCITYTHVPSPAEAHAMHVFVMPHANFAVQQLLQVAARPLVGQALPRAGMAAPVPPCRELTVYEEGITQMDSLATVQAEFQTLDARRSPARGVARAGAPLPGEPTLILFDAAPGIQGLDPQQYPSEARVLARLQAAPEVEANALQPATEPGAGDLASALRSVDFYQELYREQLVTATQDTSQVALTQAILRAVVGRYQQNPARSLRLSIHILPEDLPGLTSPQLAQFQAYNRALRQAIAEVVQQSGIPPAHVLIHARQEVAE